MEAEALGEKEDSSVGGGKAGEEPEKGQKREEEPEKGQKREEEPEKAPGGKQRREESTAPFNLNSKSSKRLLEQNSLLRQEIKVLNIELKQLAEKYNSEVEAWKEHQLNYVNTKLELNQTVENLNDQINEKERLYSELLIKSSEFEVKCHQLEALRDELKVQLNHVQEDLKNAQVQARTCSGDLLKNREEIEKYAVENARLREEVTGMVKVHRKESTELKEVIGGLREELEKEKEKLVNYKAKAKHLLKIQRENKDSVASINTEELEILDPSSNVSIQQYNTLKQETTKLQQKIQNLQNQNQILKTDLLELQKQNQTETENLSMNFQKSQNLLIDEQRKYNFLKLNHDNLTKQFSIQKENLENTIADLKNQLQNRENEISSLRKQHLSSSRGSSEETSESLSHKLKILTDHLEAKQAQIEALESERAALQLKLEADEEKTHPEHVVIHMEPTSSFPYEATAVRQRSIASLVHKDDTTEASGYVGKVVTAANMLDQFTNLIGFYLRRYPLMRIGALAYLVILHLYIFFVLGLWSSSIPSESQNIEIFDNQNTDIASILPQN
uniref:Golgin-84 n=1 Tax=Arcella intermedia TaxID=1963864 RepID=A0A6B2L0X0_9EUKA